MTSPTRIGMLVALVLAGMLGALRVDADERILSFDSRIAVDADGWLTVRETIRVQAEGKKIKRGIYRDFPTRGTWLGCRWIVPFEIASVQRDGRPTPHHIKERGSYTRLYIGSEGVRIEPGEHEYVIEYQTARQIIFHDDRDELYWNVTGNGWEFPIEKVTATVVGPPRAIVFADNIHGYTGSAGVRESDCTYDVAADSSVTFQTTGYLGDGEGLTISLAWPKGHITEPTAAQRRAWFIKDNMGVVYGAVGLLLLLVYFLVVWTLVGRDPDAGVTIPRYKPPKGLSAAAVRFIDHMGFDKKCFAAAVIDMAVKGYLKISMGSKHFTLRKREGASEKLLNPKERKLAARLLGNDGKITLTNKNHASISGAIDILKASLKATYERVYFFRNTRYWIPGLVFSALAIVLTGLLYSATETLFMMIWLSFWTVGVSVLLIQVAKRWRDVFTRRGASLGQALFLSLFALPFVGAEIMVMVVVSTEATPLVLVVVVLAAALDVLFYHLLKRPTRLGRRVMDEIDGLRLYLSVAEQDRLHYMHPPERTPELFEEFLPYALALGVEQEWSEQFNDVLVAAAVGEEDYSPSWYASYTTGHSFSTLGAGSFASSLGGSFSSAISSSASPPSSSSGGGGGGGSSGGGGGGGGGGGW
jgi:uncharacterized membrane protein YgcG